jgi:hypothetical protein
MQAVPPSGLHRAARSLRVERAATPSRGFPLSRVARCVVARPHRAGSGTAGTPFCEVV